MQKIFIASYSADLPQLELCCHCLSKNWLGNKFLTVSWGQPNLSYQNNNHNIEYVKNLLSNIFDDTWQVEIVDGAIPGLPGYYEQQVNKIRFSIDPRFQDTIVFDSKDFLLKPTGIEFFKPDDQYRVAYFKNGNSFKDQYSLATVIVDKIPENVPTPFNTTPWIWSSEQLQKFWGYMQKKFGPYQEWEQFPGATEWIDFFIFNFCDKNSTMPMTDAEYEFVNFCGIWQTLSIEQIEQQIVEFANWETMRIWKHTRKDSTELKVRMTEKVLGTYGIAQSVIDKWRNHHLAEIGHTDYAKEF
jgi:hypothetical protein